MVKPPAPDIFCEAAPTPTLAHLQAPTLDYWTSLEKYFFPN